MDNSFEDLNTRFEADEWDSIEIRVSQFEKDVLMCLESDKDILHPENEVKILGEALYIDIRDMFNTDKYTLIITPIAKEDSSETKDKKTKDKKKSKIIVSKADLIRKENTLKIIKEFAVKLINSFSEHVMQCDYGLRTNKILELRGITFMYMIHYVLTKPPLGFNKKTVSKSIIYEIICSAQRFINTCREHIGKNLSDSMKTEKISQTLIKDLESWLEKIKSIYVFDGLTIYNNSPKLLIHSQYDDSVPTRGIHMRPNQKQLIDKINENIMKGFLLFYNAAIGSGKTTLASVGIASYIERKRKTSEINKETQLIFCCNLASVRRQVARNCWNSNVKFGIASYIKSTGGYKITNHWKTTDKDRCVIIASPEVTCLILSENKDKYWLFLDEPTVGADIKNSRYLMANTRVMSMMPKYSILSSATMPIPEKIKPIIDNHLKNYPECIVDTLITKEINIGCDVITYDYNTVIPHIGCKTKQELIRCIDKINEVPFLGRLYTFRVAEKLWQEMRNNEITDILNIPEYFSNVDNLNTERVRVICMDLLKRLSEQSNEVISQVCSSRILIENNKKDVSDDSDDDDFGFEDEEPVKSETFEFTHFGTTDAYKYMNMNLIVSFNPVESTRLCFDELLKQISNDGIDITRYTNFIAEYEKNREVYIKNRDNLAKSMNIDINESSEEIKEKEADRTRKLIYFEEVAKKRKLSKDDEPSLDFPEKFQINTLEHWKKYATIKNIESLDSLDFRCKLNITELVKISYQVDDWIIFLLFSGVGIFAPSQIRDPLYLKTVLSLAEQGKLAYLICDSSICYGTNYPINRIFIMKDFSSHHSINTLFQLMGRSGRVGKSWKAEIFIDNDTAMKIINFVQNIDDTSGNIEAENIIEAFDTICGESAPKKKPELVKTLTNKEIKKNTQVIKKPYYTKSYNNYNTRREYTPRTENKVFIQKEEPPKQSFWRNTDDTPKYSFKKSDEDKSEKPSGYSFRKPTTEEKSEKPSGYSFRKPAIEEKQQNKYTFLKPDENKKMSWRK